MKVPDSVLRLQAEYLHFGHEDHRNDVIRGVSGIFSEIPGFIYKNTEFFQYCSPLNSL